MAALAHKALFFLIFLSFPKLIFLGGEECVFHLKQTIQPISLVANALLQYFWKEALPEAPKEF